jgi:hypothetical protein
MLAFELTAPDSGDLTLTVLASPGSCAESMKPGLAVRPLDHWGQ